jgi:hypothetical protein
MLLTKLLRTVCVLAAVTLNTQAVGAFPLFE